ncbi:hypothetical protein [Bordetella petrii]|uniref:hypothetical protein n=1 Tax=Bordetella petrii TaxID=94624 RepID=UPI0012DDBC3F|nr:hypothetical protein [Bordetella petrii]
MLRMSMRDGRYGLALAGLISSITPSFAAPTGNQADVQLQTDLSHMVIRVDQADPLPPGGCTAGHAWHTTYGGCRRQETRSEVAQCAAGWSGSRIRYRTAYVLQANAADVAYGAWGPWQDSCTPPRLAGVVDAVIAKARGKETGETSRSSDLTGNIKQQMQVNYGTMYGVTLYRPTATLNCIYASGTTPSSGEGSNRVWFGRLLAPGQSIDKGNAGYCRLSNGGQLAEVYGSCDSTSGGDSGSCRRATRTVRITATSACWVDTEVREGNRVIGTPSYGLC